MNKKNPSHSHTAFSSPVCIILLNILLFFVFRILFFIHFTFKPKPRKPLHTNKPQENIFYIHQTAKTTQVQARVCWQHFTYFIDVWMCWLWCILNKILCRCVRAHNTFLSLAGEEHFYRKPVKPLWQFTSFYSMLLYITAAHIMGGKTPNWMIINSC